MRPRALTLRDIGRALKPRLGTLRVPRPLLVKHRRLRCLHPAPSSPLSPRRSPHTLAVFVVLVVDADGSANGYPHGIPDEAEFSPLPSTYTAWESTEVWVSVQQ
ncbi:hypothetical protein HYPSUDRAFT_197864 [Hypholoma sublateritium FD-334 SS-4]|uniref:Uncharacterized protein n=1 Tax=Hypholoma sublateritium (strain FD-334 SS-4) TaxID=945553 RepID=A0A0D2PGS4_HYPSF|nr:hypothetical protein HYPSUDRAFT_197864 [Hypholoma sublateritium FD-334 SS-4]